MCGARCNEEGRLSCVSSVGFRWLDSGNVEGLTSSEAHEAGQPLGIDELGLHRVLLMEIQGALN